MKRMVFVNLPVRDLDASKEFMTRLGFSINEQFTDATASMVVISEEIHAMLLTHDKWRQFTSKEIVDANKAAEVMIALSCESREEVDEFGRRATAAGAKVDEPTDYGFMYMRSIEDLDGHTWEFVWMDPVAAAEGPEAMAAAS